MSISAWKEVLAHFKAWTSLSIVSLNISFSSLVAHKVYKRDAFWVIPGISGWLENSIEWWKASSVLTVGRIPENLDSVCGGFQLLVFWCLNLGVSQANSRDPPIISVSLESHCMAPGKSVKDDALIGSTFACWCLAWAVGFTNMSFLSLIIARLEHRCSMSTFLQPAPVEICHHVYARVAWSTLWAILGSDPMP
jgi:hypothetical protein